jgi:predicted  nucleic acid-binding Zn-ribbon protein
MENNFDLLEEKVRKAAELVRKLRKENAAFEEQLGDGRKRLQEAEKKLQALEKDSGASASLTKDLEVLNREVKTLRQERDEVRSRIAKLVEVLETLD